MLLGSRRALRSANGLRHELFAKSGAMASILGQLEQLARVASRAICSPAQRIVTMDGADPTVAAQIADLCTAATEANLDEYVARHCSGRARPHDISAVGVVPALSDRHTVTFVSIRPVRVWEICLNATSLTIRTAYEEVWGVPALVLQADNLTFIRLASLQVTLSGSSVHAISRVPRRPCEAHLLVAGLLQKRSNRSSADTGLPEVLRVCFPLPICRELFVMAVRSVASGSTPIDGEHRHPRATRPLTYDAQTSAPPDEAESGAGAILLSTIAVLVILPPVQFLMPVCDFVQLTTMLLYLTT
jgi:hypothetical protein